MTYANQLDVLVQSAITFIKQRLAKENPIRLYDKQTADLEEISGGIPQFSYIDKRFIAEWVAVRKLTLRPDGEIDLTGVFTGESYAEEITVPLTATLSATDILYLADFLQSKLRTFFVPVSWVMTDVLEIKAATKEEAITFALDADLSEGTYCDNSFEAHEESVEEQE